jgi:urease accessory protein
MAASVPEPVVLREEAPPGRVEALCRILGGLLGLTASATNGSPLVSSLGFLLLGGLVAADAGLSLRVATALALGVGFYHGYLNGTGMGPPAFAAAALVGLVFGVFALVAIAAALVVPLRAAWARIAVRVAGSWIAASGLLLLGWALRGV